MGQQLLRGAGVCLIRASGASTSLHLLVSSRPARLEPGQGRLDVEFKEAVLLFLPCVEPLVGAQETDGKAARGRGHDRDRQARQRLSTIVTHEWALGRFCGADAYMQMFFRR